MRPAPMTFRSISGMLGVCLVVSTCAVAQVFPLKPVRTTDPAIDLRMSGSSVNPRPHVPLRNEPEYRSLSPQYGRFSLRIPDREYDWAIDESKGSGTGYNRIRIDTDGDHDLGDEVWAVAEEVRDGRAILPLVGLKAGSGVDEYVYYVAPELNEEYGIPRIRSAYHMQGTVAFGEREYLVALFDDNLTSTYNDPFVVESETPPIVGGDVLVIDLDGDGKFAKRDPMTREAFPFGTYLLVDGDVFKMQAPSSGRELRVRPYEGTLGRVHVQSTREFVLDLLSPEGGLRLTSDSRDVRVPAGTYVVYCAGLEGKTADGFTWRAACWGNTDWKVRARPGMEARIDLADTPTDAVQLELEGRGGLGATWTIYSREVRSRMLVNELVRGRGSPRVGEPLQLLTTARETGDALQFRLELKDGTGTVYAISGARRDGERVPAPSITIKDAAGHVVHQGNFRYG
ncbi:MAG: hypothetical protein GY851_29585 [bacterium]|nr:hypothetical protein [bacterium]